jgi:hypothetical protein
LTDSAARYINGTAEETSAVSANDADRARHTGAVIRAVAVRVLGVRQVLLVVVLGGG